VGGLLGVCAGGKEGVTTGGLTGFRLRNKSRRFTAPQHWAGLPLQVREQTASKARVGLKAKPFPHRQVVPPSIPQ
jgi:hypothetical protein